jgi:hypothetical protein
MRMKIIPSTTANNGRVPEAKAHGNKNTVSTSKIKKTRA